jgi:hypothetical protein
MSLAKLSDLLTENEINLLKTHEFMPYKLISLCDITITDLYKISIALLPIIYPNGLILESKSIVCIGWEFLTQRAIEKNFSLFY